MSTPSRAAMRPLPHSTLGAVPDAVTRSDLADGLSRLMAIGRSPVGNEAARRMLMMIDRYANTAAPPAPVAPHPRIPTDTRAMDELRSKLDWCTQDRQRWEHLAEQRAVAIQELTDQAARHGEDVASWRDAVAQASRDFDVARAEVGRLSKEATAHATELAACKVELAQSVEHLDLMRWLHAEAVYRARMMAASSERFFKALRDQEERAERAETALAERDRELDVALERADAKPALLAPFSIALTDQQIEQFRADLERANAVARDFYAGPALTLGKSSIGDQHRTLRDAGIITTPPSGDGWLDVESPTEPVAPIIEEEVSGPVKRCGTCQQVKPLAEYHLRSRHGSSRHSTCKGCDADRRRAWRASKREDGDHGE